MVFSRLGWGWVGSARIARIGWLEPCGRMASWDGAGEQKWAERLFKQYECTVDDWRNDWLKREYLAMKLSHQATLRR